jgi:hypothetical protein
MHNKVNVEAAPVFRRDSILKCVVQRLAAIDCQTRDHPHALKDSKGIPINREHVAVEAVQQHTASALPG